MAGTNFGRRHRQHHQPVDRSPAAGPAPPRRARRGEGLNIGLLRKVGGTYTLGALAKLPANQAGANILSTPNLVALDNEEAKIVVGQNVPFITGSFTNTGGSGAINPFQTIERKDVGITLRIRRRSAKAARCA